MLKKIQTRYPADFEKWKKEWIKHLSKHKYVYLYINILDNKY